MSRQFHPDKCHSSVRAQVSFCGMAVTLVGKHAFEWSICIEDAQKRITITTYPNRKAATKEFNKYRIQAKEPTKSKRR